MIRTIKIDSSGWRRKLAKAYAKDPRAARVGVAMIAFSVCRTGHGICRKDTRRYARALAQMGNGTGIGFIPVLPVQPSKYALVIRDRLVEQVQYFETKLADQQALLQRYYPGGPPKNPRSEYYRNLTRDIRKTEKLLQRSKEELEKVNGEGGESSLLIGGFFGLDYLQKGRKLATVRNKVYGGETHFITGRNADFVVLHNKEPHASIVEARDRIMAIAIRAAQGGPVRRVSNRYFRDVMGVFKKAG